MLRETNILCVIWSLDERIWHETYVAQWPRIPAEQTRLATGITQCSLLQTNFPKIVEPIGKFRMRSTTFIWPRSRNEYGLKTPLQTSPFKQVRGSCINYFCPNFAPFSRHEFGAIYSQHAALERGLQSLYCNKSSPPLLRPWAPQCEANHLSRATGLPPYPHVICYLLPYDWKSG